MMPDDVEDRGTAMLSALAVAADGDNRWDAEARARVRERVTARAGRRRRWRPTALALVGGVVILGGGAVAVAQIVGDGPAREEVQSYATDAGISESTARSELLDQSHLPALVAAARERLGDAYAGVWVDAHSRRIVLAVAQDAPAQADAEARQAATAAGLDGRVDVVRRPHDERQLETLRRTIDAELERVNRGAPTTIDVEVDLAASRVIVRRPPRRATDAQRRYLETVRARYGAVVELADSPGELKRFGR